MKPSPKNTAFALLLMATVALSGQADPVSKPASVSPYAPILQPAPARDPGGFCRTPDLYQPRWAVPLWPLRPKPLHLSGPGYDLTCATAAWQASYTQAMLDSDIVLTSPNGQFVIFCNQAWYDKVTNTVSLQGAVRVTVSDPAGKAAPAISTGDSGTIALGPGAAQIVLHTDPPQAPKRRS